MTTFSEAFWHHGREYINKAVKASRLHIEVGFIDRGSF
jgi:hypothetical protein